MITNWTRSRHLALALLLPALTGCASGDLTRRIDMAEKRIHALDRTDANVERALNNVLSANRRYEDQLRRIEVVLGRQQQAGAELDRAVREALAIAQESAAFTRQLEIRRLGNSFLVGVKP